MEKKFSDHLKSAIWGFVVGDALGVPYEFKSRKEMDYHPATDMVGYGTHDQPPGTWSDDSSLLFCLIESLIRGYDLQDLANRFINWYRYGYWTPHGEVFDIGISTREAILKMEQKMSPTECGGKGEYDNGNGALMRILPMAFYLFNESDQQTRFYKVKEIASLTHAHNISHIGCFIYTELLRQLIIGKSWRDALNILPELKSFFTKEAMKEKYILLYDSIFEGSFLLKNREEVYSRGFVVHTLEASLWCIKQSKNYKDAVLLAVNLGEDTDTTAAVTGGLAGLIYGFDNIPSEWRFSVLKKHDINTLLEEFENKISS